MIGQADDLVQAFHLGDRVLDDGAGVFIDDMEDRLQRLALGFGLGPAGEVNCDRVHHLNPSLGIAGNDSIADGGQGGAQLLLGAEDLFGAAAEDIERGFVGAGDSVQTVSGEQANGDAYAEGEHQEKPLHVANLAAPEFDACGAALLGVAGGVGDILTDTSIMSFPRRFRSTSRA